MGGGGSPRELGPGRDDDSLQLVTWPRARAFGAWFGRGSYLGEAPRRLVLVWFRPLLAPRGPWLVAAGADRPPSLRSSYDLFRLRGPGWGPPDPPSSIPSRERGERSSERPHAYDGIPTAYASARSGPGTAAPAEVGRNDGKAKHEPLVKTLPARRGSARSAGHPLRGRGGRSSEERADLVSGSGVTSAPGSATRAVRHVGPRVLESSRAAAWGTFDLFTRASNMSIRPQLHRGAELHVTRLDRRNTAE